MNSEFFTERYLTEKKNQSYAIVDSDVPVIERLCKKIDVVKKVYQVYSADLSFKICSREIKHESYRQLLKLMCSAAISFKDYKFLNTALKLNDLLFEREIIAETQVMENFRKLSTLMIDCLPRRSGAVNERS